MSTEKEMVFDIEKTRGPTNILYNGRTVIGTMTLRGADVHQVGTVFRRLGRGPLMRTCVVLQDEMEDGATKVIIAVNTDESLDEVRDRLLMGIHPVHYQGLQCFVLFEEAAPLWEKVLKKVEDHEQQTKS